MTGKPEVVPVYQAFGSPVEPFSKTVDYLASQLDWALLVDNRETRCYQSASNVPRSASRVGSSCYLLDYVCFGHPGPR